MRNHSKCFHKMSPNLNAVITCDPQPFQNWSPWIITIITRHRSKSDILTQHLINNVITCHRSFAVLSSSTINWPAGRSTDSPQPIQSFKMLQLKPNCVFFLLFEANHHWAVNRSRHGLASSTVCWLCSSFGFRLFGFGFGVRVRFTLWSWSVSGSKSNFTVAGSH